MYRTRQQKRGSVYDRSDRYNGIKTIHDAAVPRKDEAEILDALFSLDIRGDQISQLRHDGDDDGKDQKRNVIDGDGKAFIQNIQSHTRTRRRPRLLRSFSD